MIDEVLVDEMTRDGYSLAICEAKGCSMTERLYERFEAIAQAIPAVAWM
jgi:hypothetical protein